MMHSKGFRAWKDPAYWGDSISLVYYEKHGDRAFYSSKVDLTEIKRGELVTPDPVFNHIPREAMQQLMDELWECGLRPAQGAGSAGQLAAVERHLADMQRLVFKGTA